MSDDEDSVLAEEEDPEIDDGSADRREAKRFQFQRGIKSATAAAKVKEEEDEARELEEELAKFERQQVNVPPLWS